jgi:hypothetical protein
MIPRSAFITSPAQAARWRRSKSTSDNMAANCTPRRMIRCLFRSQKTLNLSPLTAL